MRSYSCEVENEGINVEVHEVLKRTSESRTGKAGEAEEQSEGTSGEESPSLDGESVSHRCPRRQRSRQTRFQDKLSFISFHPIFFFLPSNGDVRYAVSAF